MRPTTNGSVYVVRQDATVFVAFVVGGAVFSVAPWTLDGAGHLIAKAAFSLGGAASFALGIWSWKACRIGLVIDRHGIWVSEYSLHRRLVPWKDIRGARKYSWTEQGQEEFGIVLDLDEDAAGLFDPSDRPKLIEQWEQQFGKLDSAHPLLLGHDEWDWDVDACIQLVTSCIDDPAARNALGDFKANP